MRETPGGFRYPADVGSEPTGAEQKNGVKKNFIYGSSHKVIMWVCYEWIDFVRRDNRGGIR